MLWELGEDGDELPLVAASMPQSRPAFGLRDFDEPVRHELQAGRAVDTHLGLLIPLVAHDALIGLIGIEGDAHSRRRSRAMLGSLAYQAALALESAALTENLLRRESEARLGSLVRNSSESCWSSTPTRRSPTSARQSGACSAAPPGMSRAAGCRT